MLDGRFPAGGPISSGWSGTIAGSHGGYRVFLPFYSRLQSYGRHLRMAECKAWTLRETSQDLGQWTSPKEYLHREVFATSWPLRIKTLPLWSPLSETMPMNLWFEDQVAAAQFVEIVDDTAPGDSKPRAAAHSVGPRAASEPRPRGSRQAVCGLSLRTHRAFSSARRVLPLAARDAAESSRSAGEKHARIPWRFYPKLGFGHARLRDFFGLADTFSIRSRNESAEDIRGNADLQRREGLAGRGRRHPQVHRRS